MPKQRRLQTSNHGSPSTRSNDSSFYLASKQALGGRPPFCGARAVSQLLWSHKGREEWFSLGETTKGGVASVYTDCETAIAAASSILREPVQTLCYPMAGPCACTDESPPAWIPSRRPQDTAARRWQSNDSAIPPNLRFRSLSLFRNGPLRWTTSTLPPRSPSRPAPVTAPVFR
jgi:hypothetical protein